MGEQSLHPSVQKFKQFVKNHPLLVNEVREGRKTWQDFYEEWVILGENHENWESYKKPVKVEKATEEKESTAITEKKESSSGDSSEALSHLIGLIKNMNFEDIQRHISQLSSILASVQQLMGIFQGGQKQNHQQSYEQPHDPFSFRGF